MFLPTNGLSPVFLEPGPNIVYTLNVDDVMVSLVDKIIHRKKIVTLAKTFPRVVRL